MALVALSGIAQAVAAGAAAMATRDVFAALYATTTLPLIPIAVLLIAGLLIAVLRLIETVMAEWVGQHFAAEVRQVLFGHLMCLSPRDLARRRSGSLALRFVGDLAAIRNWVSLGIARLVSAAFVLPGAIFALWLLNPALAGASAGILLATLIVMSFAQRCLAPLQRRLRSARARIAVDMSERAPVAAELRLQGRGGLESDRLNRTSVRLRQAALKRSAAAACLKAVPDIGLAITGAVFMMLAFRLQLRGAEIAAGLAMLGILAIPMRHLAVIWDRHRAWQIARRKCVALLNLPAVVQPELPEVNDVFAGLRLDSVSHLYLRNLDCSVERGQKVAVLGPNGNGKSSLLTLVAGLEQPEQGFVTLAGASIAPRDVCYVGDRSPLLRGSLRRAFTMGLAQRPSRKQIEVVATSYGLGPLLERLDGLDGKIAEAGKNLSSGEVRRIHLVRATLSRAPVLLLDEPEEALDPAGRLLVQQLIEQTPATVLYVTHDVTLARMADQVWFLENGEVFVAGSPAEAFSRPGPIRDFVSPRKAA